MGSATPATLYNIIKRGFGDEVFVDICVSPPKFQSKAYYKEFPAIVGAFSHRTWEDFDIVGISVAIAGTEFAEAYRLLSKARFPLGHKERLDDGITPLLVLGGVAADNSNGFDDIVDLSFLGLGERTLPILCSEALSWQGKRGSVAKAKRQVIDGLKKERGAYCPSDYPYGWVIEEGVVKSSPRYEESFSRAQSDTLLDIGLIGGLDIQRPWPLPGAQSRASVLASWGCGGSGACSFCHEGHLYGPWRERTLPAIEDALEAAKASSMGDSVAFRTFNINYYSRFPELLMMAYRYFDLISVLNLRLDVMATSIRMDRENNYVRMLQEFGAVVLAGAVEGFGERVRNHLYNKGLSFQDIRIVAEEAFRLKFMKLKTGYILSGHETGDDMKEGLGEIKELAALKRSLYSNTQYQVTVTKMVHFWGTPMYRLPRVASWLNWQETFGGDRVYYPFLGIPKESVTLKYSGIGDTFIQQLHQDLPCGLSEEILLQPAIDHYVGERGYLEEVRKRMEAYGISPKKQFLDFDPAFTPKKHLKVSPAQDALNSLSTDKLFLPRSPCLKTVSSQEHFELHRAKKCQCDACDILGIPYRGWLFSRGLSGNPDIGEIRAVRKRNEPSFFYALVFYVGPAGRHISKDALVRQWMKEMAKRDGETVFNFRRFEYSFSRHMEYPQMVSNYHGYEVAIAGFKDEVAIQKFWAYIPFVNAACPTIKLQSIYRVQEKPRAPGFWALSQIDVDVSDSGALKYLIDFPFRKYNGFTYKYSEVKVPFYYRHRVLPGSALRVELLYPAKVNPSYNLMEAWHFNKFNKLLKDHVIAGVYSPIGDGKFSDLSNSFKTVSFPEFTYVER